MTRRSPSAGQVPDAPSAARGWRQRIQRRTELPIEHWPEQESWPRVLVECDDSAQLSAMEHVLGRAGYAVASCSGPTHRAECAMFADGSCDLVAGADVVVNCLGLDTSEGRSLVRCTKDTYPDTPLVVEVSPQDAAVNAPLLADSQILMEHWRSAKLLRVVDDAVMSRSQSEPGAVSER